MHACVRDVFAINIYDDNILSRLIMIIITIIILYFIQIRHTDDFPSAGIPASHYNKGRLYNYYEIYNTHNILWIIKIYDSLCSEQFESSKSSNMHN